VANADNKSPPVTPPLLRLLADNIPILIAYYRVEGLVCEFANAGYARTYAKDTTSIIGKSLPDIIGEEAMAITQPYIDGVVQRGETVRYERPLVFPNGQPGYIEVSLVPHFDEGADKPHGAFVLVNDITRYRQAEIAIRESEERLRKFSDATTEGIAFQVDGVVVDCNSAGARMMRCTEADIIGKPISKFIAPESLETVLANIRNNYERPYEATLVRHDGSRLIVELIGRDVQIDGRAVRMTAFRDISERKQAEARIQFLAHHDTLTHLPNRAMVMDRLQVVLAAARRQSRMVAVMFLDLDNFKTINDSLGHHAGDALLKRVSARLKDSVRDSDLVGRLGGDEFLIVLTNLAREDDVLPVVEKIAESISEPFSLEEQVLSVSGSIGISVFPKDGNTPDTLVRNADAAMYLAKDQGRSNYQFFTPSLSRAAFETLAMESGIRKAIKQVEFLLHYQPQVDLATGRVESLEALIRWRHPELGIVGPDQFISVAEHRGLIVPIGRWVINEAIRQVRAWRDAGFNVRVAINLSAMQFKQKDLVDDIAARLRAHEVPGSQLEIELTESLFMDDVNAVTKTLGRLRDLGVTLAVDDFGTGYSSLSYLKRYPIDKIKIDRSFVRDVPTDPDDVAIALAIIGLAQSLDLKVVAEGVENDTQLEFLKSNRCHGIQGYYISRPLPAEDIPAWFAERQRVLAAGA
jgi:diguanylate cyclase (GGDEF)-like protein/PAS domain S-box-containing protein